MLPPWKAYPLMAEGSLGWSFGSGEFYWIEFRGWYGKMSPAARDAFERDNAEPSGWTGFYGRLRARSR